MIFFNPFFFFFLLLEISWSLARVELGVDVRAHDWRQPLAAESHSLAPEAAQELGLLRHVEFAGFSSFGSGGRSALTISGGRWLAARSDRPQRRHRPGKGAVGTELERRTAERARSLPGLRLHHFARRPCSPAGSTHRLPLALAATWFAATGVGSTSVGSPTLAAAVTSGPFFTTVMSTVQRVRCPAGFLLQPCSAPPLPSSGRGIG